MTAQRSLAELERWHAQRVEDIIDPARRIVDPHHHLWFRPPEAFQFPELMTELQSGHDIRATVFVQNNAMYRASGPALLKPVGETEYVNGIAAMSASGLFGTPRLCAGIVSWADLRDARVGALLDAHQATAGNRFKGIRQQAQWNPILGSLARTAPPEGLLRDADFRRGFKMLGAMGLRFDAWIYFSQLRDLAELAATAETPIILNHIGAPLGIGPYAEKREDVFAAWSEGLRSLAAHPNVSVKIGGMGMPSYGFGFESREVPASSAELAEAWQPYVNLCIETFGAERCMFESNFPVDKASTSYRTLWNTFKRLTGGASEDEKAALFEGTARRVYDLGCEGCEN